MRTRVWTFLLLLAAPLPLAGQSDSADGGAAFNRLRTPVSPAFVVLGVAPTVVERPNTPADLALSVLTRSAALTSLPRDIALELSPYWLIGHPSLTWQSDTTRNLGTSLARTTTLSFATAELGTDARPVTGLALGFRAAPFSGRVSDESIVLLKELQSRLAHVGDIVDSISEPAMDRLDDALDTELRAVSNDAERNAAKARRNSAVAEVRSAAKKTPRYIAAFDSLKEEFGAFAPTREGFVLEVAAAAAMQAPGAVADSASLARWGAWITAGYQGPTLSFVFVNRFLASSVDSTFDSVDLGMRLIFTSGRYALSAEGSFRSFTENGAPANEYRVAALVDFELQKGLWVNGSFGRDYTAGSPGSLIAQLGVSMNLAGERIALPIP